jgi:hypothetical protein
MSGTNTNGVTYTLGTPFTPFLGVLTTPVTITNSWENNTYNIPSTDLITTSGTYSSLVSVAATLAIMPNITATVNFSVGLLTTVHVAGTLDFGSTVNALGTTFDIDGGTVANSGTVSALGVVTANIGNNGVFDVGSTALSLLGGVTVTFENSGGTQTGGTFIVDGTTTGGTGGIGVLTGTTINNFANANDKIEFTGITAPITRYVITNTTTLGTVTSQTVTFYSGTSGTTKQGSFVVQGNNLTAGTTSIVTGTSSPHTGSLGLSEAGGNLVFDVASGSLLCFLTGTLIRTPDGERAIETLKIGDLVMTVEGKVEPVRWMGISTNFAQDGDPLNVMPIRIRAGALGDNMPVRDLLVSSEHALLVDGVLVQAGALVNGLSVVRDYDLPETFTYYHVELASHELILAEGVPAETFVDNVDRMAFDNWAEHEALYGDRPIEEMLLPRAQSKRQVKLSTQRRLLARAELLFGEPVAMAA